MKEEVLRKMDELDQIIIPLETRNELGRDTETNAKALANAFCFLSQF